MAILPKDIVYAGLVHVDQMHSDTIFFLPEPSSSQPLQMMGGEGKGIGPQGVNSRPAIGPGQSEIPPSQYNLETPTMVGGGNCKYTRVHCMQQALRKAEPDWYRHYIVSVQCIITLYSPSSNTHHY